MQNDRHSLWALIEVKNKKTKTNTPGQTNKNNKQKNSSIQQPQQQTRTQMLDFFSFLFLKKSHQVNNSFSFIPKTLQFFSFLCSNFASTYFEFQKKRVKFHKLLLFNLVARKRKHPTYANKTLKLSNWLKKHTKQYFSELKDNCTSWEIIQNPVNWQGFEHCKVRFALTCLLNDICTVKACNVATNKTNLESGGSSTAAGTCACLLLQ